MSTCNMTRKLTAGEACVVDGDCASQIVHNSCKGSPVIRPRSIIVEDRCAKKFRRLQNVNFVVLVAHGGGIFPLIQRLGVW